MAPQDAPCHSWNPNQDGDRSPDLPEQGQDPSPSLTQGMSKAAQRKLQATAPPQQREPRPALHDKDDCDGQVEHEVGGANARSCRPLPSSHQPRHALLKRQEPGVDQGHPRY